MREHRRLFRIFAPRSNRKRFMSMIPVEDYTPHEEPEWKKKERRREEHRDRRRRLLDKTRRIYNTLKEALIIISMLVGLLVAFFQLTTWLRSCL